MSYLLHRYRRAMRALIGPTYCRVFGHYAYREDDEHRRCYCGVGWRRGW